MCSIEDISDIRERKYNFTNAGEKCKTFFLIDSDGYRITKVQSKPQFLKCILELTTPLQPIYLKISIK